MAHRFLTPEWIEAAAAVRARHQGEVEPPTQPVRMNLVITEVPFGDGTTRAYVDTSSGTMDIEFGALENPDVTVTADYETAKAILVDQDPTAGVQALTQGKVMVQGDLMKVIALGSGMGQTETAKRVAAEIKAITA